eukprot:10169823-Lingulodinium_polyedra.AAC.1
MPAAARHAATPGSTPGSEPATAPWWRRRSGESRRSPRAALATPGLKPFSQTPSRRWPSASTAQPNTV